jgi:hypothetical protein
MTLVSYEDTQQVHICCVFGKDRACAHPRHVGGAPPVRERLVEVLAVRDVGPLRGVGAAELLEDLHELVDLALALERRLAEQHLADHAADAPHVDRRVVLTHAKHDLRRAVAQRHHLRRGSGGHEALRVASVRAADGGVFVVDATARKRMRTGCCHHESCTWL